MESDIILGGLAGIWLARTNSTMRMEVNCGLRSELTERRTAIYYGLLLNLEKYVCMLQKQLHEHDNIN